MSDLNHLLQQALAAHQAGHWPEAERLYSQLLTHCRAFSAATPSHSGTAQVHPCEADARHLFGLLRWQTGQPLDAISLIRRAIQLQPQQALYQMNLGAVLQSQGELQSARECFQTAVRLQPRLAGGWNNLATIQIAQDELSAAEQSLQRAIEVDPQLADAWCTQGDLRRRRNDDRGARESYAQAIRLQPELAVAWNNLGLLHYDAGRLTDAAHCFQQALNRQPDRPAWWTNLALAQHQSGDWAAAQQSLAHACQLDPHAPGPVLKQALMLPVIPESLAQIAVTREQLRQRLSALEQSPLRPCTDPVEEIGTTAFYLPYQGLNDRELQRQIDRILRKVCPDLPQIGHAGTTSSAVGSDEAPQPRRSTLRTTSPLRTASTSPRWRVGFVSRHWHDHSNARLMTGLVQHWPRTFPETDESCEVLQFHFGEKDDAWSRWAAASADRSLCLPRNLHAAREQIRQQQPDVLIYTDLGMEPLTWYLAASRLAPRQCTTWGVPVTTGLATIDLFLSSELLETPDAELHYSEQLVRLPLLPTYYYHPLDLRASGSGSMNATTARSAADGSELFVQRPLPPCDDPAAEHDVQTAEAAKERSRGRADRRAHIVRQAQELRRSQHWPEQGGILLCPQSLFKLHPEFDDWLAELLRQDRRVRLILLAGNQPRWTERLADRLKRRLGADFQRVQFWPRCSPGEFLILLAAADLLLDPLHFGGGNTTFEALALGTPIVTCPGPLMRSRVTQACLRQMDFPAALESGIATDRDGYLACALDWASNSRARIAHSERLLQAAGRLFETRTAVQQMAAAVQSAWSQLDPGA